MNWERAKNILIVFFLILNIALASILVYMRYTDATLSEELIQSTAELLEQHNIKLSSEEVIPKQSFKNQNFNLNMILFEDEKLLKNWLGEGYQLAEGDYVNHQFVFINKNKRLKVNKTGIEFILDKNAVLATQQSGKEIENFLSSKLKKLGFTQNKYYFRRVWYENGLYNGIISPLAEKTKIVGIELKISADKEDIVSISGNCFSYSDKETYASEGLMDLTSVLANMIYLSEKPASEIIDISYAAYVSEEYIENKSVTAVPVYVITCADGAEYYYDARTGELLKQR